MVRRLIQSLLHDVPTNDSCDTESSCVSKEKPIMSLWTTPTRQSKQNFIQVQSRQLRHRIQRGVSSTYMTKILLSTAVLAGFLSLLVTLPLTNIPSQTNTQPHTNQSSIFRLKPYPRIIAISKQGIRIDNKYNNFQDREHTIGLLPTQKRRIGGYQSKYSNPHYSSANPLCARYNTTVCKPMGKWQLEHHPSCNVSHFGIAKVLCVLFVNL